MFVLKVLTVLKVNSLYLLMFLLVRAAPPKCKLTK